MITINLKQGGHLCVEPFDDHEEEDRCKIYDSLGNYLDYIPLLYEPEFEHARYDNMIKYLEECDIHNYLGAIFSSYDYGHSLEELFDNVYNTKHFEYIEDDYEENRREFFNDLERYGETNFCAQYLINKIGDLYIAGED